MDFQKWKPEIAQVALQASLAVLNVATRIALLRGMNQFVFVAYRQIVAALVISPIAFIRERNERPPLTMGVFLDIFVLALCGITLNQNMFFAGMSLTGSTFASAMTNLLPACTFVTATLLGLEKTKMKSMRGQLKVLGTLGCVSGAMIMTFYRGPAIKLFMSGAPADTRFLGSALLLGSVLCWSIWLTLQSCVIKRYPAHLTMISIMFVCAAAQCCVVAVLVEKVPWHIWSLSWNMELLTCIYGGLICSAFALFIQSWCLEERGPVFVAIFSPVGTILVAIMEITNLHYTLHIGSLVGALVIMLGLYLVLWGKKNDQGIHVDAKNLIQDASVQKHAYAETNVIVDITLPLLCDEINK